MDLNKGPLLYDPPSKIRPRDESHEISDPRDVKVARIAAHLLSLKDTFLHSDRESSILSMVLELSGNPHARTTCMDFHTTSNLVAILSKKQTI